MANNIIFQEQGPFDLMLQTTPTARAQDETVVVTLPVFAAGMPRQTADIRLSLSLEQAEHLWAQLDPAMRLVRFYLKTQR